MTVGPIWRSLLYVPANVERFVERAASSGADAIQLDLEDGVAPSEKVAARNAVAGAARRLRQAGADVIVRINQPLSLAARDIEHSVGPDVAALSLPKTEGTSQVALIADAVAEAELRSGMAIGATRLIVGIETPRAWLRMADIARAHPRIVAMLLGGEDFAHQTGIRPFPEALQMPKQALVIAAASAGIQALGIIGSFADYRDTDALFHTARRSRDFGFMGSSCIHPAQVAALNAAFSPDPEEVEKARAIITRFDTAQGQGAVAWDGAMLDRPVVERARRTVDLATRIAATS